MTAPPVIVGIGLAGLSVALTLAPHPVILIGRKSAQSLTSSEMAQGGIAAAIGADDSPALHAQDTLTAGAGLCDPAIVNLITNEAPAAIERLAAWGVPFDREADGTLKRGLEGAHSRRRIVHAHGDSTGAYVMKALMARARATPSITILEETEATALHQDETGAITGLSIFDHARGEARILETGHVILATGSATALWQNHTVPHGSWGHGLLLAARAGARLKDLEFVQFHPTGLDTGRDPMPLISEALRGEGAFLVNEKDETFVDELAPRDIVSRAIWAQIENGHRCYLDARPITNFAARFPTVMDICTQSGIDPATQKIPIRPTAHYHMGGIATDKNGRTNVRGLWACGECACTGLHGANRLASNSLLEAAVMGARVGEALNRETQTTNQTPSFRTSLDNACGGEAQIRNPISVCDIKENKLDSGFHFLSPLKKQRRKENGSGMTNCFEMDHYASSSHKETEHDTTPVRAIMTAHVGLHRDAEGLAQAITQLSALAPRLPQAEVALMIARAALAHTESIGAHCRDDAHALPIKMRA